MALALSLTHLPLPSEYRLRHENPRRRLYQGRRAVRRALLQTVRQSARPLKSLLPRQLSNTLEWYVSPAYFVRLSCGNAVIRMISLRVITIIQFSQQLPSTTHDVHTFDCHPLLATINTQGSTNILVNVNGTVKYADESQLRIFAQTFILAPDTEKTGNFYVRSDSFR
ncbi:hypothetical protein BC938DRAFT_479353 [Jimgerdemannia flammicorona]|uniref:NTF2 domain-containing protein n=1 Tax=Jimgerdemannia flammicorona TaxID=994334 RepID=A0A433QL07_9FUNG|nr:hypothetical protein BC938DRAFT_479353 [Jimgerdemannia flammicorona]